MMKITKVLVDKNNDLKNVKIHDFKKYMENPVILEQCSRILLQNEGGKPVNPDAIDELMNVFKNSIDKYHFI